MASSSRWHALLQLARCCTNVVLYGRVVTSRHHGGSHSCLGWEQLWDILCVRAGVRRECACVPVCECVGETSLSCRHQRVGTCIMHSSLTGLLKAVRLSSLYLGFTNSGIKPPVVSSSAPYSSIEITCTLCVYACERRASREGGWVSWLVCQGTHQLVGVAWEWR